ncbi:MAG TPA: NUDIX hydrolase [Chloroflexia bacterium]|nr:NUDIX hydrolase [Chloroflexia bacterium]
MPEQTSPREIIAFERDSRAFGYRVAGVVVDEGRVLLQKADIDDFWIVPGGRVELREPAAESLKREMMEEIGVEVTVERLLWVVENFFEYQSMSCHEVAFYFLVSLPPGSPLYDKSQTFIGYEEYYNEFTNENKLLLTFQWFPVDDLHSIAFYPSFLKDALQSLPDNTVHVVHVDTVSGNPQEGKCA